MFKNRIALFLINIFFLFLAGCATENITLPETFWQDTNAKVTVALVSPPEPALYQQGQEGLLDIAMNNVETRYFRRYLANTDLTWYSNFRNDLTNQLKQKHIQAKAYSAYLNPKLKNYTTLAVETGSDKLLIIKLSAFGATRPYYGFIPLGPPQAYCVLNGELIDTENNQVIWRDQVKSTQQVIGRWDQPPNYLNFGNALNLVIETSQNQLLNNFFTDH